MCLLFFTVRLLAKGCYEIKPFLFVKGRASQCAEYASIVCVGSLVYKVFFAFRLPVIVPYTKIFHLLHHA